MPTASDLADEIRAAFLHKPFGVIKFWGAAVVPPEDSSLVVVSTLGDGDRLDLVIVTEEGRGLPSILSVWEPAGLERTERGIEIRTAKRLRMDDVEAWLDGAHYHHKTPAGVAAWPLEGEAALKLGR